MNVAEKPFAPDNAQSGAVLVVGADGLIGRALVAALQGAGVPTVGTSRRATPSPPRDGWMHLDLAAEPHRWVLPDSVKVAYLLAGVTSMAACDADPAGTERTNVTHTIALAGALEDRGAHVCYVSTNLVLAGDTPFAPAASPLRPQSLYAAQKARVEQALLSRHRGASLLRITKIVEGLDELVRSWATALRSGQMIAPFSDLMAAPIPRALVVDALTRLGRKRLDGLHQISADADMSYADIARKLAARLGVDDDLVRPTTSVAAGKRQTPPPLFTTLDARPTERLLGLAPTHAAAVIDSFVDRIMTPGL
jgi:dTDP-4-dehydrorhamnose reductase